RCAFRKDATRKIGLYKIKTRTPDTPISALSGGNVQRAVLARELAGDVEVLIAANPCFALDFAAVAQIHAEIMAARNRGAAVLLVSEDLDELLELSDRLVVMFHGEFVHEARASDADLTEIGRHMAGHWRSGIEDRHLTDVRRGGDRASRRYAAPDRLPGGFGRLRN